MPSSSPQATGYGALAALVILLVVSIFLGTMAQRAMRRGAFLKGYFLGNRGLGAWALALTATVQSGGTFMGYPSLVYTHGWVVGLWIASYMVVPLAIFGVLAKRTAQISRRTGAITVPDLFRERFASPTAGLVSSLLVMFFITFALVAQFKAGASIMKVVWPAADSDMVVEVAGLQFDALYMSGLAIFAFTVVTYTIIGGFLGAVWTDLFQSVLMLVGVLMLLALVLWQMGGLEAITTKSVANTSTTFATGPGYSSDQRMFLTEGLAASFFFVWIFGGMGSPATLVRLMACKSTQTIRRSIVLLAVYNVMIYLPLLVIGVAARAVMPDLQVSDEAVVRMAIWSTSSVPGGSLLAGIILIAPFGAVLATVSAYLVVIASGVVRDIYQRFVNPQATAWDLRWRTYFVIMAIGLIAVAANLRPVAYLQAIVVFAGSSGAASFVVPAIMSAFWRRATAPGVIAAMLAGGLTAMTLLIIGTQSPDPLIGPKTTFRSFYLLGLEPVIWGLLASLVAGVSVSLCTRPPPEKLLSQLFDAPTTRSP
jgi:SSS family solute:Na+ symporter/sodium/pantothenate symporter